MQHFPCAGLVFVMGDGRRGQPIPELGTVEGGRCPDQQPLLWFLEFSVDEAGHATNEGSFRNQWVELVVILAALLHHAEWIYVETSQRLLERLKESLDGRFGPA